MTRIRTIMLAAALAASQSFPVAADAPGKTAEKIFELQIKNDKVAKDKRRIRVTQGDKVRLRWLSDKAVVLHLHGYNIERRVEPGITAEMAFDARASGKFPIHAHGEGEAPASGHSHRAPLTVLEVYPR